MSRVKDWLMDQQEKGKLPFPDEDVPDVIVHYSGYTVDELSSYSEKERKINGFSHYGNGHTMCSY